MVNYTDLYKTLYHEPFTKIIYYSYFQKSQKQVQYLSIYFFHAFL